MTFAAIFLGMAAVAASSRGVIECLTPPPPCEALQHASFVLTADVIEAYSASEPLAPNPIPPQIFRIKVIERFKGVSEKESELTGRIWHSSEAVLLEAGRTFLVYATPVKGYENVWQTGCSRTKPLDDSSRAEVQELRKCRRR